MKKIGMIAVVAAAVLSVATGSFAQEAQTMSLTDAKAKISEAVEDPGTMAAILKQLSSEDQVAFLAIVNGAIESMPGSNEEKAAKFLDINTVAVKSANKGNLGNMLAEVFATVPAEALAVVNESFAANLFNRAADPSVVYTDEQFTRIAQAMTDKVAERNAGSADAGARNTFAVLMFVRASNGSPADLANTLTENFDPEVREQARNEWIPAGLESSYDSMLGAADAGEQPDVVATLRISAPQTVDAILADMAAENIGAGATFANAFTDNVQARFADPLTPGAYVLHADGSTSLVPWDPSLSRENAKPVIGEVVIGYKNQTTGSY
ncbi:MAG: hypothetical protein IKO64_04805 [Kiritimatiellae bacterium]|nr:hypothetical protein [Kiritimatiellia bacterium]